MASYLLDTNVVLRLIDRQDPKHSVCRAAVDTLIERQEEVCLVPQVLVEFWVVATRPAENNGLGWEPDETDNHIGRLCGLFRLRPELPDLFDRWRQLVRHVATRGKRAHDARLAAFMAIHGIDAVVTLDPSNFRGFGIDVVEPGTLASRAS